MSSHASAENLAFDHVDDSATNNDVKLPYDLIIEIAKQLPYQGCMRTVASLSVTSQGVKEVTLPTLYDDVHLEQEKVFVKSIGMQNSAGWARTRYLHLSDIMFALLKQQQRYAT